MLMRGREIMKYFTKEAYKNALGSQEKMEQRSNEYQKYYKSIEHLIPKKLQYALNLHENELIKSGFVGKDFIIEFDPIHASHAISPVTKLVFKNAVVLANDEPEVGSWTDVSEIYVEQGKYEIHILFSIFRNGSPLFRQIIVQADDILFEERFRNSGLCEKCGRVVSDPTKEEYEPRVYKGTFVNEKWFCEDCVKLS